MGSSFIRFGNEPGNGVVFNRKISGTESIDWTTVIQELELNSEFKVHVSGNIDQAWEDFRSHFNVVEAAGGLVRNDDGFWLFIYRNGMWDLPKGKLEKGETIENCAVREVAEECGIAEPTIVMSHRTTFHTYEIKGQRILKPTYWFLMKSSGRQQLKPQTEEGISEVKWISTEEAETLSSGSFGSIRQVVTEGLLAAH